jgi:EAL and modified HD-GYP domain-containing signal transduction protein
MTDIFVARQPIFKQNMSVFAYELLFRSGKNFNGAEVVDGDSATSQVLMHCFVDIGLENIVGSHKAFINLTRTFLANSSLLSVAPPDQLVLEVLEDIEPSDEIIETLKALKKSGHTIALDDFIYDSRFDPFIEQADIIKIDVKAITREEIEQHVAKLKTMGVKLLAEKVEDYDEFEFLKGLGFDYYQGYFFSRPKIVSGKSVSPNQLAVLNLVAKINNPDIEVDELSAVISSDVSLSHKVLKFINSPVSGLRTQVDSIQQAVVLLGLTTIKNWVTILALATGSQKPTELGITALIRAKCCELMAKSAGLAKPDGFFTVGLFSSLDAMLDQPLDVLLAELPLSEDTNKALLKQEGILGQALRCAMAMEHNDFSRIEFEELGVNELSELYLQAVSWANETSNNF